MAKQCRLATGEPRLTPVARNKGRRSVRRERGAMAVLLHAPSRRVMVFWTIAQASGVIATVILIAGLLVQPELALPLLWNVLIPVLPASFLIAPGLWRGVCPLATLNMLPNGVLGRRSFSVSVMSAVSTLGIVSLVVLVPARRFLFNEHGAPLAVVVIAVAVAALVLGGVFDLKAGFCNAICPVLPVEKLYGQHPFLNLRNPRCCYCTRCVPRGCIDLAPRKSALQALGRTHRSSGWLRTAYGVFVAAFPGFVIGYFRTTDSPLMAAPSIYLHVALWAGGSYLVVALITWLLKVRAVVVLPVLAATAVGLYYWFVAPSVSLAFGGAGVGTVLIRIAAFGLAGAWLWRALGSLPGGSCAVESGPR